MKGTVRVGGRGAFWQPHGKDRGTPVGKDAKCLLGGYDTASTASTASTPYLQ